MATQQLGGDKSGLWGSKSKSKQHTQVIIAMIITFSNHARITRCAFYSQKPGVGPRLVSAADKTPSLSLPSHSGPPASKPSSDCWVNTTSECQILIGLTAALVIGPVKSLGMMGRGGKHAHYFLPLFAWCCGVRILTGFSMLPLAEGKR